MLYLFLSFVIFRFGEGGRVELDMWVSGYRGGVRLGSQTAVADGRKTRWNKARFDDVVVFVILPV